MTSFISCWCCTQGSSLLRCSDLCSFLHNTDIKSLRAKGSDRSALFSVWNLIEQWLEIWENCVSERKVVECADTGALRAPARSLLVHHKQANAGHQPFGLSPFGSSKKKMLIFPTFIWFAHKCHLYMQHGGQHFCISFSFLCSSYRKAIKPEVLQTSSYQKSSYFPVVFLCADTHCLLTVGEEKTFLCNFSDETGHFSSPAYGYLYLIYTLPYAPI